MQFYFILFDAELAKCLYQIIDFKISFYWHGFFVDSSRDIEVKLIWSCLTNEKVKFLWYSDEGSCSEDYYSSEGEDDAFSNEGTTGASDARYGSNLEQKQARSKNKKKKLQTSKAILKAVEMSAKKSSETEASPIECPICLSEFVHQLIGIPESCRHLFCFDCIKEWSKVCF